MTNSQPKWSGYKIITQTYKVMKTEYQKYTKTSARVGYALSVWKQVQVQGLNDTRLTIEDRGLVSS